MNGVYGIRIPAAFESKQRWYDINAYGGRQLAAWSRLITGAGVTGFFISSEHRKVYLLASVAVTLFAVIIPVLLIHRWSHKN